MCWNSDVKRWHLTGITSWGSDKCKPNSAPGVYTRVNYFFSWLRKHTESRGRKMNRNQRSKNKD